MSTLRELRKASGRSVAELAREVGVSTNSYYSWEWGQSIPSGRNLVKLESLLPGAMSALVVVGQEAV